ncbi:MAG: anhydro-N-acetylmuramic acid kinase [Lacipirellulaceae bacterium]
MAPSPLYRSVGLASSASGDGVEAAVIDTDGQDEVHSLGGISLPYDDQLQWSILEATQNDLPTTEILRLEKKLTQHHIEAFGKLRSECQAAVADTQLVGFRGHLLRHIPSQSLSLEIGNPWQLSEALDLPVVSDFRRHDMTIGGTGAPLSAMFHWALMAKEPRPALMLNLDSIASVTWLSRENEIIAGDVGPGVGLLNEWVQEMAQQPHDLHGRIASEGKIDQALVEASLQTPFFKRPLPKAADRHEFDHIDLGGLSAADGAATMCAITVRAFIEAAMLLPEPVDLVWLTGPGSEHPVIVELLKEHIDRVQNVTQRDLNPHTMSAECFAWMAVRHLRRLPITTPETSNCRNAECAGFSTLPLQ